MFDKTVRKEAPNKRGLFLNDFSLSHSLAATLRAALAGMFACEFSGAYAPSHTKSTK